ncbi:MAG: flavodoxin reductase [Bacteroidota bacterium]|nr:flavodoxin reductase [Bacteroidota bacterium]
MEEYVVKIISSEYLTHDVKRLKVEKPDGYTFISGQATEVSINKPGWTEEKRPFTFTSLNKWRDLEFTIKCYREHNSVTKEIEKLQPGDELIIRDVWGAITYQGKGVFIAGGAGITPFISILRQLDEDKELEGNKLIFSNKTSRDIILKDEFERMLRDNFYNVLTREKVIGYNDRRIDEDLLKQMVKNFGQHFYICGPEDFVKNINDIVVSLGAKTESVVIEK